MSAHRPDLEALLSAADKADPAVRIEFRDAIASFGRQAIPPMTSWLRDRRLGAFAVRVLIRIGEQQRHANAVHEALQSVGRHSVTDAVARDMSDAIDRLTRSQSGHGTLPARSQQWPGDQPVTALERRFHEAMLEIFQLAGEATRRRRPDGTIARGYWASYFLRGVRNHGGLEYARRLLRTPGTTDGFQRLAEEGRLDLTMEALVLKPQFSRLFTEAELSIASRRLGGRAPQSDGTDAAAIRNNLERE